jgi:hypothetical protein
MLSSSLSQRARTLTSLARCRAASAAVQLLGGDGGCDALAADDVNQTQRVYELLGKCDDHMVCVSTGPAVQQPD